MDIFSNIKRNFEKVVKIREVIVDNNIFQLHYRVTSILLVACGLLVASKQHFGDPIDCISKDDVPPKVLDTYCWVHGTFTLPGACNKTVGVDAAHPCVDSSSLPGNEEKIYHKYYQWVYFMLFFQAICFYVPHYLWKQCEARKIQTLTAELKNPLVRDDDEKKKKFLKRVVRYLNEMKFKHQEYFHYFTLFEVTNLVNVIIQFYLVDAFLGGSFTTYGLDVIKYSQTDQDMLIDPMVRIFPRMTKCTFHRYGSSGDVQRYDSLCILPLNIINEKIYISMWFWFVFLAGVTGLWLIYRLFTYAQPSVRYDIIIRRSSFTDKGKLKSVLDQLYNGDWFLLSMMCKNMNAYWFKLVIDELHTVLRKERQNGRDNFPGLHTDKEPMISSSESSEETEDKVFQEEKTQSQPLKEVVATEGDATTKH